MTRVSTGALDIANAVHEIRADVARWDPEERELAARIDRLACMAAGIAAQIQEIDRERWYGKRPT